MRKNYRVIVAPSAASDLRAYRDYIARDKPQAARRWMAEMRRQMASLRFMPLRFERIPEADDLGFEFRHIIVGNYRIFFEIRDDEVHVLRVIHAARRLGRRDFAS